MFSNPFPNAFGLDIGDLSIKLVQLRNVSHRFRGASYELMTARSINIPPGLVVNGELEQPEQVRHYIQKLLQGKKGKAKPIKSPWVVAGLPETQGFIKLISIAKNIEEIIDDDIIIESKKHIPFTEEDKYYLDWQILPSSPNEESTHVLISAIPKFISDSYTYLFESLGLGVVSLEIEALSIARSMVTAQKEYKGEARAILDIGSTRSSLIVYDENTVQFSTSLPYSGEVLTTAIEQKLRVSHEEAEGLKRKYGLEYKKQKKVWGTLMEQTKAFADTIRKSIHFYYSHFPDTNQITHITMCGSGSNMKHLEKILSLELKIECRSGKPWKNLQSKKEIKIPYEESIGYATAIGLALRAADNPFFKHDSI
ncbi:type IV pilus assembly protein PilM [Candidatus Parcubacteria bacterium]|jgi:type IV pilus assembly protein PilM|nr:type IV pilus assembly protein PilM [Candidatus Parcubacteria bacterium]MBT3948718.1 type IV pilus assembly protein PilM [Candidatus Parcubacteria bacterium]